MKICCLCFIIICAFPLWCASSIQFDLIRGLEKEKQAWLIEKPLTPPLAIDKYQAELHNLAFETFLSNQQTEQALSLALSIHHLLPQDSTWLERVVTTALWSNRPKLALKYLTKLLEVSYQQEWINKGIKIAEDLNLIYHQLYLFNLMALQQPLTLEQTLSYANLLVEAGYPEQAISMLHQSSYASHQKVVTALSKLYHDNDNLKDEKKLLTELNVRNSALSIDELKRLSYLLIENKEILKAYELVKQHHHRFHEPSIYKLIIQMAEYIGNENDIIHAYEQLHLMNALTKEELIEYIRILSNYNSEKAYQISKQHWNSEKSIALAMMIKDLGIINKDWKYLVQFFQNLPEFIRRKLEDKPHTWLIKAVSYEFSNLELEALKTIEQGLERFPNNIHLLNAYYQFVIKHGISSSKSQYLSHLYNKSHLSTDTSFALADYYMHHGRSDLAFYIYHQHHSKEKNNLTWLDQYEDILDYAGEHSKAHQIRVHALQKLSIESSSNKERAYAELYIETYPGDKAFDLVIERLNQFHDYELYLHWCLLNHDQAAFEWLKNSSYAKSISSWDYVNMTDKDNASYYFDVVNSLQKKNPSIETLEIAKQLPNPKLIYSQAIQILQESNTAEHESFNNIDFKIIPSTWKTQFNYNMQEQQGLKYHSQSLETSYKHQRSDFSFKWQLEYVPNFNLITLKKHRQFFMFNYTYESKRNFHTEIKVGYHKNVSFENLLFDFTYGKKILSLWEQTFNLAFNQVPNENILLYVLGTKHQIMTTSTWHISSVSHIWLQLVYGQMKLLKESLYDYLQLQGALVYEIFKYNPQLSTLIYMNHYNPFYVRNALPNLALVNLISLYGVPQTFTELGIGADLNPLNKPFLSKRFIPIASIRLGLNSQTQLTHTNQIGFFIPLIANQLNGKFLFEYSSNRFNIKQSNTKLSFQISLHGL